MRYALTFATLIASAAALSARLEQRATPTAAAALVDRAFVLREYKSINPDIQPPAKRNTRERGNHYDTNAKRLAAGLPLKAPTRRFNHNRASPARQLGFLTCPWSPQPFYFSLSRPSRSARD